MNTSLIGFIAVAGIFHLFLIVLPLKDTLQAPISLKSKIFWFCFLVFLTFVGAFVFHRQFNSGAYQGETYEISAAEERARAGTFAPDDGD